MSNVFNRQLAISLWYLGENGLSQELCAPLLLRQLCWWHFGASTSDPSQNEGKDEKKK